MAKGSSKAGGGAKAKSAPKDPVLERVSAPAARLEGIRVEDIKPGDTISDRVFNFNGEGVKRAEWTFHPEGYDAFKSQPHSDLRVTDVKVTGKQVKVTALFDRAVTKRDPKKEDFGKDFMKVTKTFKRGEVTQKRLPK